MASLADENDLEDDSADTADDGAPTPTADVWFMNMRIFHPFLLRLVKLRDLRYRPAQAFPPEVASSSSHHRRRQT
jgi:hypothetical protein